MNADEWARVQLLRHEGETIKGIARRLGMSRNTVRRAFTLAHAPGDHRATRGSAHDRYADQIAAVLRRDPRATVPEIARLVGTDVSRSTMAKCVERVRHDLAAEARAAGGRPGQLDNPPTTTIPAPPTPFVGRRRELAQLRESLGSSRLITVVGPGGIGKTRLAIELAGAVRRAFHHGVRFVELGPVRSATLLPEAVLDAVGVARRPGGDVSTAAQLVEVLRDRDMLLVLDNCEHLIEAAADLLHLLLRGTTRLRIIATSRERLGLPDESVFPLTPLPLGSAGNGSDSALALFEQRARAVLGGFTVDSTNRGDVERICDKLEGLPLAIELACARLPALSLEDLARRLDHRLDLLTTGNRAAPERHRSLTATMEWSFDLCTSDEQLLWARCSVFAGVFDLAVVEEVCTDPALPRARVLDALSGLVSKSILLREDSGRKVRFRMLETIKEYGQSHLQAGAWQALRCRQARWCAGLLDDAAQGWFSAEQQAINEDLTANRANIRQALEFVLQTPVEEHGLSATAMVGRPWFLWAVCMSVEEHCMWLQRAADRAGEDAVERARTLAVLGLLNTVRGDRNAARTALGSSLTAALEDAEGPTPAFVRHIMGLERHFAGDFEEAHRLLVAALELYSGESGSTGLATVARFHLGKNHLATGDAEQAAECFTAVRASSSAMSERWMHGYAEWGLGAVALLRDDCVSAVQHARRSLELVRVFDDSVGTTLMTDWLAWSEASIGAHSRAAVLLGAAVTGWGRFGSPLYGSDHWQETQRRYEAVVHDKLGDREFRRLADQGSAMSRSALLHFALADDAATRAPLAEGEDPLAGLTPRERQVAGMLAEGRTNAEIAARLVLSPRTVEGHVQRVLQKLYMTSRSQVSSAFAGGRAGHGR